MITNWGCWNPFYNVYVFASLFTSKRHEASVSFWSGARREIFISLKSLALTD